CLEIQFYLVYAILMMVVTRLARARDRDAAFYAVLLPCVALADLWAVGAAPFHVEGLFVEQWYLFLAGMLVGRAATRRGDRTALALCAADLGILAIGSVFLRDPDRAVATLTGVAIALAGVRGKLSTWLSARPLQWLGAISYSLYLYHAPILGAAYRVSMKIVK